MPDVRGRIIEPWLGSHTKVEHTCRTEGNGYVEFDMVAKETGHDLVEFPLIESDWDGAADPDPERADSYVLILVIVLERRSD
jgi:hypothetical protein